MKHEVKNIRGYEKSGRRIMIDCNVYRLIYYFNKVYCKDCKYVFNGNRCIKRNIDSYLR